MDLFPKPALSGVYGVEWIGEGAGYECWACSFFEVKLTPEHSGPDCKSAPAYRIDKFADEIMESPLR